MTDKFDNSKPNIILISDNVSEFYLTKSFGVFKVARELRLAGYQVAVIHHAHIFTLAELQNILKVLISEQTLFVGVSNFYYRPLNTKIETGLGKTRHAKSSIIPHDESSNQAIKKYINLLSPNCKLVAGGPNATDTAVNQLFDYVVVGYADSSVVNLANHLNSGEELRNSYRSVNGFTVVNDATAPDFDFVNSIMEYKSYDCILPDETLLLEVSRGCIFKCAFCSYPLNGKNKFDFIKNRDLLKQELIDNYNKYQVTRYLMLDDTFNDSVEKVRMIFELSKELPFKLQYWAYLRLDLLTAHPETIDMLVESGLRAAFFGIESLNPDTCRAINKGGSRVKQWETLNYIKSKWGNKIACHGSFIIGLPHEPIESINRTFDELMDDNCPLDTWEMIQFILQSSSKSTYSSSIDQSPAKYGYIIDPEPIPGSANILNWKNEYLDYQIALTMAKEFHDKKIAQGKKMLVRGQHAFELAALGIDLDWAVNHDTKDINYYVIKLLKQKKSEQYKKMFYEKFNIDSIQQ
jgi:hypothetical protein